MSYGALHLTHILARSMHDCTDCLLVNSVLCTDDLDHGCACSESGMGKIDAPFLT